jgi:hypothetical protein
MLQEREESKARERKGRTEKRDERERATEPITVAIALSIVLP